MATQRITVNLSTLNPSQKEAVLQIEGPVLILAGAGSGKTRVVTTRIAHMIASGIRPPKICALTFTNKAANEMRERVGHYVPGPKSRGLTVSTFHSLCVKILRAHIDRLGYKTNFTIYTGSDQLGLVRQLIARLLGKEEKIKPDDILSAISTHKNTGRPIGNAPDDIFNTIAKEYQRQLKLHNAVDFDDLLGLCCTLFEKHSDVRTLWGDAFHYVMVDEFQDTNKQQMAMLKTLVGTRGNVCVVGDDDQSIYGWRGAESANILQFERFFPNPKIIRLQENYRSQAPILHTANAVIKNNKGRREKQLIPTKVGENPVRLIAMPGDEEEAQWVVNDIWERNYIHKQKLEDCAILFRTNAQTRIYEEIFRSRSIPYRILGGQSFYERREVKDVMAYLKVCFNPQDDINLLRIVNNPPRGIGETTIEAVTEFSIAKKISIFSALRHPECQCVFPPKVETAIKEFIYFIEKWGKELSKPGAHYGALSEKLVKDIGYIDYLKRSCRGEEEEMNRESNVNEFIQTIYTHETQSGQGMQHFIDNISLDDNRFSNEKDKQAKKPGAWLITMHASKGLEFPYVYLVGLEEGILPSNRALDAGTKDEERRLLYVGITRAMEQLTMSFCASRVKYGKPMPTLPSSFIDELPFPPVVRQSYEMIQSKPATKEQAQSHFANIKAMLGVK